MCGSRHPAKGMPRPVVSYQSMTQISPIKYLVCRWDNPDFAARVLAELPSFVYVLEAIPPTRCARKSISVGNSCCWSHQPCVMLLSCCCSVALTILTLKRPLLAESRMSCMCWKPSRQRCAKKSIPTSVSSYWGMPS